jgi:Spirocyclase AveC-like
MNARADIEVRRRVTPAAVFAALGVTFVAFQLWIFIRWAADGQAHPVSSTPDNISAVATWMLQAVVLLLAVVFTGIVVCQCRRDGHITFDAALLLGYFLSFWQSPLFNYEKVALVVNRHSVNVTSWGPYIPGWDSPRPQDQPETLLGLSGAGFVLLMMWVWIQAWLTGRIARRFPDWTWSRLLPACLLAGLTVDVLIEAIWMNTGFYNYAASPTTLTLFHSHWSILPLLYFAAVTLFISTAAVVIRHDTQVRGTVPYIFCGTQTVGLRLSGTVRLLAGVGLANVLLLAYFITCVLITHFLG